MAAGRVIHTVGLVLLFASLCLLIVTCLSTPDSSLPIFTLKAERRVVMSGTHNVIKVKFGLWGYCQTTSTEWGSHPEGCVRSKGRGYSASAPIRRIVDSFRSSVPNDQLDDLTKGLALPAVAITTTVLAIVTFSSTLIKRNRWSGPLSLASLALSALSFIFTVSAVGCAFSLFEQIRPKIPNTSSIRIVEIGGSSGILDRFTLSTEYGVCAWTLAASCGALLLTTVVLFLAWRADKRGTKREWSDAEIEKKDRASS